MRFIQIATKIIQPFCPLSEVTAFNFLTELLLDTAEPKFSSPDLRRLGHIKRLGGQTKRGCI
jgi:hypothetical protein